VGISDVSTARKEAQMLGYDKATGVVVEELFSGTPAWGKLQKGDIVTAIDDKTVNDSQHLRDIVAQTVPGTELKLTIFRDGKTVDVMIKVGDQPENMMAVRNGGQGGNDEQGGDAAAATANNLGLHLSNLTDDEITQLGLQSGTTGALIKSVDRNSLAAKSGLEAGMVITQVGRHDVANADEAANALSKVDPKKGVLLYVTTRDGSTFIAVKSEADDQ
jgi:serine protease Do